MISEIWQSPSFGELLVSALVGYLAGSIPSGVIVSRFVAGRDPRDIGSGHTGGLNVARTIGWLGFFLAGIPDVAKGLAAVLIVQRFITANPWASVVAGIAAVVGHCWSIYIGFRGGMGVGTSAGLMAYYCWPVVPVMMGLWLLLRKTAIRHTARSVVIAMFAAGPLTWLFSAPPPAIVLALGCSAVLFVRYQSDWNRNYSSTKDTKDH